MEIDLVNVAVCKSLILDIAIGSDILASCVRNRNSAWISDLVVILVLAKIPLPSLAADIIECRGEVLPSPGM